jgi:Peptidase family M1 domain
LNTGTPFYTLEGHSLEIPLSSPLVAGGEVVLSLDYHLNLPASDEYHLFGYKINQVNLVDWYPFIAPYRDDWLLHAPSEVGEHLVYDSVDFDVTMQVVPSMTIAASAPLVDGRYHLEKARTIVFSASPDFETTAETIAGVNVNSYYFESEKPSGETLLHETGAALTTFNDLFLEYPYPSLSIVESGFFDGMEYDGLIFIGRDYYISNDGTKLNYLIDLAVHETAHQWWFGMVGNDQALEPWLDESLSTYSELLFYEKNYPGIAESWWQFRVDRYSPSGKVDSTIYTLNELQAYTNSVYFQGARFLRDLRAAVGDETFFSFMESYASQMTGRISTAEDFFRILRQFTNVDLSGIQDTYFEFQH